MKYRLLVVVPFVALGALWLALALVGAEHHASLYRVDVEFAKAVALTGCAVGALGFAPGDYLRRAWLLLGACYLMILANDLLVRPGLGIFGDRSWAPEVSGVIVAVGNAASLVGTVMIARTWRVAGFELAGSPALRRAVVVGAVAIAAAAGGWLVVISGRDVMHGQAGALNDLFSSIADIISFSLIAPFLLTAIALRGGSLAWTWALLTASLFGWLLFDATLSFGPFLLDGADAVKRVSESCRLLACTFGAVAGVAQRLALTGRPAAA